MSNKDVSEVLSMLAAENNDILLPEKILIEAERPSSPLHSFFEWDDTEAARQYRLVQARELVRVHVRIIENVKEPVRAYVSLSSDRVHGGGYRPILKVLSDTQQRGVLLQDALRELESFRIKYQMLVELGKIFEETSTLLKKQESRKIGIA
jgi:hypothetical protein